MSGMKVKRKKKRRVSAFECSFCGKSDSDANFLVIGPKVHICDNCVVAANVTCAERGVDVIGRTLAELEDRAKNPSLAGDFADAIQAASEGDAA